MNPLQIHRERAESGAIFTVGCILGVLWRNKGPLNKEDTKRLSELLENLDLVALERFLKSDRSNPTMGSDFVYRKWCLMILNEYKKFLSSRNTPPK